MMGEKIDAARLGETATAKERKTGGKGWSRGATRVGALYPKGITLRDMEDEGRSGSV
jgi:hypothetical protein